MCCWPRCAVATERVFFARCLHIRARLMQRTCTVQCGKGWQACEEFRS